MGRGRTELRRSHPRTRRAELYRVTEAKKRIDCDGAGTDTAARRRHEVNFRRTRGEREVRRGWRATHAHVEGVHFRRNVLVRCVTRHHVEREDSRIHRRSRDDSSTWIQSEP